MVKTLKDQKKYPMTMEDEAGFFAVLLAGKEIPDYVFVVQEEGKYKEYKDPYRFPGRITRKTKCSLPMGSDIIFMKSWEPIRCAPATPTAYISPSGRPMRCGSACRRF